MNYDPNIYEGTHTVKVTLQEWDYTGYVIMTISGNCKGASILESAIDLDEFEDNISENQCKFKVFDEPDDDDNYWFSCILYRDNGDELDVEDELNSLSNYIVKAEIIDYVENKEEHNNPVKDYFKE